MPLTLKSQLIGDVVLVRPRGRIVLGDEVESLVAEIDKQTKIPGTDVYSVKCVVLQLAETDYIDSGGLGALIRLRNVLGAAGGGLHLCCVSPAVLKVLEVTHLVSLFFPYASENEAIEAFSKGRSASGEAPGNSKTTIVCIDQSADLLAGLHALLTRSGYEVFTTRYLGSALTFVAATHARLVICGPTMLSSEVGQATVERLRQANNNLPILQLAADFLTAEAGQASVDLVSQVRSMLP